MRVLVGCPVYERAWILPRWFDHIEDALWGYDVEFVFALTPSRDGTDDLIRERGAAIGPTRIFSFLDGTHSTERRWSDKGRIETMVAMRNKLLRDVRYREPDYYFSLDSDILIPRDVTKLFEQTDYDAVSPLAYLGSGSITNAFTNHRNGVRHRVKVYDALQTADVLCAAKVMSPLVYEQVNYSHHRMGEDIGWSDAAKAAGFKLGIDTSVRCKHVMSPDDLERFDARIGW